MKARKSPITGHVLLDVDESGVKLLAQGNAQPPFRTEEYQRFVESITERATKPFAFDPHIPLPPFAHHA